MWEYENDDNDVGSGGRHRGVRQWAWMGVDDPALARKFLERSWGTDTPREAGRARRIMRTRRRGMKWFGIILTEKVIQHDD
jgi:hypothetical protein